MKQRSIGMNIPKQESFNADGATFRQACLDEAGGDDLTFVEGHDDAICGIGEIDGAWRVVYDSKAIVRQLMRRDGMDEEAHGNFSTTTLQVRSQAPLHRS